MLPKRYTAIQLLFPAIALLLLAPYESFQGEKSIPTENDTPLLEFAPPYYPALARAAVLGGTFELQAQIGSDRRVLRINRANAFLNVPNPEATDLFWHDVEKELRKSWRFSKRS